MNPARIVFPEFWFGQSDIAAAEALARRGVGGFCIRGGSAAQTLDFTRRMNEASPSGHLLFCVDIREDLSEVITDAPSLPKNSSLLNSPTADAPYRKGNLLGRMARAAGINWVLAPVVDLGYTSPSLGEDPFSVMRLAEDMIAGISNAGALSCIKYFPGISGVLKTLLQLEEAEIIPYKHLFRRADAIMPSDMVFPNLDNQAQATFSEPILQGLLRKRLNYKGVVVGFPLSKAHLRCEEEGAITMLRCGVGCVLAPRDATSVIDAVERSMQTDALFAPISHAVSSLEMFVSKVCSCPESEKIETVFEIARSVFE